MQHKLKEKNAFKHINNEKEKKKQKEEETKAMNSTVERKMKKKTSRNPLLQPFLLLSKSVKAFD